MNRAGGATMFLAELGMLIGLAWWGLEAYPGVMSWVVGIGLPVVVMGIWAVFLSPRAPMSVPSVAGAVVRLGLLLTGAAAFWAVGIWLFAVVQAVLALVATVLTWRDRGADAA